TESRSYQRRSAQYQMARYARDRLLAEPNERHYVRRSYQAGAIGPGRPGPSNAGSFSGSVVAITARLLSTAIFKPSPQWSEAASSTTSKPRQTPLEIVPVVSARAGKFQESQRPFTPH